MKKVILSTLAIYASFFVMAQSVDHQVQLIDGNKVITIINPVKISAQAIALQYNVSLDLLALYNQIKTNDVFEADQDIIIPLSESNFFRTNAVSNAKANFYPIYYQIAEDETRTDVCKKFLVTESTFQFWNKDLNQNNLAGKKAQVGWLKLGATPGANESYSVGKKSTFSTELETMTTSIKDDWKYVKTGVNDTWHKVANSFDKKTQTNKEIKKDTAPSKTPNNGQFKNEVNQSWQTAKAGVSKTTAQLKTKLAKKSASPTEAPAKVEEEVSIAMADTATVLENVDDASEANTTNEEVPNAETTETTETTSAEIAEETNTEISAAEETENTAETTKASAEGKATWFYSGSLGSVYHVFTNAASKGTIIELINPETNKKITATVLGALSKDEEENGTLFIVSDNAMESLGAKREIVRLKMIGRKN